MAEKCVHREVEKILGGHPHVLDCALEVKELLVEMTPRLPQHGATTFHQCPGSPILAPFDANCSYHLSLERCPALEAGGNQKDYLQISLFAYPPG
jgi:hypothetical protein